MINDTQLKHPAFLARVKAATVKAVYHAHRKGAQLPIGYAIAHNRKGAPSLLVSWHSKSRQVEYFDRNDNDVTPAVLAAFNNYHEKGL